MSNTSSLPRRRVRAMAVQYRMQACSNFDEFAERVRYFAGVALLGRLQIVGIDGAD